MADGYLPPNRGRPALTTAWWLGLAALIILPLDVFYIQLGQWLAGDGVYALRRDKFYLLFYALEVWRMIPPLALLSLLLDRGCISRFDIGWTLGEPRRTLRWIIRPGLVAVAVGGACNLGLILFLRFTGIQLQIQPSDLRSTARAWEVLVHMCLIAPVMEELIYRSVLVSALAQRFGTRTALWGSGLAFMILHLLYHRPAWWAPFYFATGVLFAWAYVRSGSIVAPIVLHSIGNFAAWLKDLILLERRQWAEWLLGYPL